jgi:hypothetical protein
MKRSPGVLKSIVLLLICDVALRVFGFARTLRWARRVAGQPGGPCAGDAVVQQTIRDILVATALYPGRSKCLEQTVALFILLRRREAPVEIKLGVQPYPFYAHAWLELNGMPLTESPEVIERFALMPDPAL